MTLPAPSSVAALLYRRVLAPVRRELAPFLNEDVERGDSLWNVVLSLVGGLVAFAVVVVAVAAVALPFLLYALVYAFVAGLRRLRDAFRYPR